MPTLLLVVFLVELAVHFVNTIGAASINNLLWTLYLMLPTETSKGANRRRDVQTEYMKIRRDLNATSSQDEFAKWAKLRRQHDKLMEQLEKLNQIRQHGGSGALVTDARPQDRAAFLVLETTDVLAAEELVPVLRRMGPVFPAGAAGKREHRVVADGLLGGDQAATIVKKIAKASKVPNLNIYRSQSYLPPPPAPELTGFRSLDPKNDICQPCPCREKASKASLASNFAASQLRKHLDLNTGLCVDKMAISWGTIKSLLLFFGPILLPKAIGYYRSFRAGPAAQGLTIKPLPPQVIRALGLLGATTLIYLLFSLPPFTPENLFARTQSRLQIPTDVLFTRLTALRPGNILTDTDTALRAKFVNLESRLLYLQFGPGVLADCPFCNAEDPRSYLYYAVPGVLAPHLFNLVVLSAATSGLMTGQEGSKWRTPAVLVSAVVAALDIYIVSTYNYQLNARATRLVELDMFFWSARVYRLVTFALINSAFAALLYLSSTNRAFATPPSPAERVEAVTRQLMVTKSKLNALGIVKNTAIRDEELRERMQSYWQHEGRLMREVMEEREVLEGVNDALSNRINITGIQNDAETYASNILPQQQQATEPVSVG
ncbi:hypothetical protein SCAR479_04445 [Seiridium cardinale]|uniref:Uncharacterized protein n=1 Tax=Seiridium cardinale TaxID=138064 RepID=A0ABR2XYK1_9PEZI